VLLQLLLPVAPSKDLLFLASIKMKGIYYQVVDIGYDVRVTAEYHEKYSALASVHSKRGGEMS